VSGTNGSWTWPSPVSEWVEPVLYGVFCSDDRRSQLEQTEWIIKGIDGQLYLVPSEPGG